MISLTCVFCDVASVRLALPDVSLLSIRVLLADRAIVQQTLLVKHSFAPGKVVLVAGRGVGPRQAVAA